MFRVVLKNKELQSEAKKFFSKNKGELFDIILFGSLMRGKEKPSDIDILLFFKNKESTEMEYTFRKMLESVGIKASITSKTYTSFVSGSFIAREGILAEGYSLIHEKYIAEGFGYVNYILFKYQLRGMTSSQRMQFQYSLYGRDKKGGIVKELELIKFSDCVLLSPVHHAERTKEYLSYWKIQFEEMPILIPVRFRP